MYIESTMVYISKYRQDKYMWVLIFDPVFAIGPKNHIYKLLYIDLVSSHMVRSKKHPSVCEALQQVMLTPAAME